MRFSRRAELTAEAIALVLLPTATVIGVGVVLHRLGALDAGLIALAVAAGAVATVTIPLAVVAYRRGRARLRGVQALQFEVDVS